MLLEAYLRERASLVGLVVTIDIRRGITPLDDAAAALARAAGLPVAVLLTKADKLSRGAGIAQQQRGRGSSSARRRAHAVLGADAATAWARRAAWLEDWLRLRTASRNKEAPGAGFRGRTRGANPGGVSRDSKTPH